MPETENKPVSEAAKGRKKTVLISMLTFLITGGGIFLYFIIQGSKDLTGPGNSNFHYGSVVRNSVTPFFKYIGVVGEDEEALARSATARLKARGVLPEEEVGADLGDWLKSKTPDQSPASPSAGASYGGRAASSRPPAEIPRMGGGGGGGLPRGGGSSNTAGASRFSEGSGAGNTKISGAGAGAGAAGGAKQGGTLGALRGAQAMLTEGLRSGSAMTARSKWDKSFGVSNTGGAGGGRSGSMSYDKKGLVDLDTIKSGELKNLKAGDFSGPSAFKAPPPSLDKEAAAEKAKEDEASGKTAEDVAKDMAGRSLEGLGKGGDGGPVGDNKSNEGNEGKDKNLPPQEIAELGRKQSPEGSYCPHGCNIPPSCETDCPNYKDNPPKYEKGEDGWVIVYSGQQTAPNGAVTYYADRCFVDSKSNTIEKTESFEGSSPNGMPKVR